MILLRGIAQDRRRILIFCAIQRAIPQCPPYHCQGNTPLQSSVRGQSYAFHCLFGHCVFTGTFVVPISDFCSYGTSQNNLTSAILQKIFPILCPGVSHPHRCSSTSHLQVFPDIPRSFMSFSSPEEECQPQGWFGEVPLHVFPVLSVHAALHQHPNPTSWCLA